MIDINRIMPKLCMHKIYLEYNHKPSAQHQFRLNPLMKEVVMNEIKKWLDYRIMYPI